MSVLVPVTDVYGREKLPSWIWCEISHFFFFFFLDTLLIKWYRLLDISQHELLGFSFNQPLKLRSTCLEMGIVEKLGITWSQRWFIWCLQKYIERIFTYNVTYSTPLPLTIRRNAFILYRPVVCSQNYSYRKLINTFSPTDSRCQQYYGIN